MSQEKSQVYHFVAYEFAGQKRADEVVDLLRKSGREQEYKVAAWAVIEVDDKGKPHVHQSGHGGKGTAAGAGVGLLLGLVGGPAGLLVWTLGGALLGGVAGKLMGHQFDKNELAALATGMGANTSAIIAIVEDKAAEAMAKTMGQYDAKIVTLTMGSQLSGELASFAAVDLGEDAGETETTDAAKAEAAPAEAKPAAA
jgi:uncharacterized membrane protein